MKEILTEIDKLQREIDSYRPLPAHTLKQLKEYYRVGLTYSSNALEGNSLTETETKVVLEDGITIGGKPIRDYYEALGHSEAYDYIYKLAKDKGFTEDDINWEIKFSGDPVIFKGGMMELNYKIVLEESGKK